MFHPHTNKRTHTAWLRGYHIVKTGNTLGAVATWEAPWDRHAVHHHGRELPQESVATWFCFLPNLLPSFPFSLYLQSVSLSLCNHILYTIGSQSNLMHRYSLIKLICRDSLFQSVLDSFMPPYQNTHTLTQYILIPLCSRWQLCNQLKCHAVHKMLLLIISWSHWSSCSPSSTIALWLVTPNGDNKQPTRMSWSQTVTGHCSFGSSVSWNWTKRDGVILAEQRVFCVFFQTLLQLIRANKRKHTYTGFVQ